jgi:hypothetical protein
LLWVRAAGYGWLIVDITTDIVALQGVADTTYLPMRYGEHASAALWIAPAAREAHSATRIIDLLLALDVGGLLVHSSWADLVVGSWGVAAPNLVRSGGTPPCK